jgi:M6 family metalloprotease-like protein
MNTVMLSPPKADEASKSQTEDRFFSRLWRDQNDRSVFILFFLFLFSLIAYPSFADESRIFEIKGLKKAEKQLQEAKPEFISQVSQKSLLGLKRKGKFALPVSGKEYYAQAETLKVLGIRVEFEKEVPDDPKTTGDGLFDRRTYQEHYADEGHIIDPPPHFRKYFLSHLKALNNYWNTVSNGKLVLQYEVYPIEEDSTYRLPQTISYYGDPASPNYPFEMLRQFFHDSFHLADSVSPEIDFSEYNCFIIFHAGSDKQSDLGSFSPTYSPNDLYTGFIITGDTVLVDNGNFGITEGMLMPETRSQDTRIGALNAVFAHEFGHQLGLPDFYNTKTFTTQIGDFSLMDNNGMDVGIDLDSCRSSVSGLLPVYPDAWGKAYLGYIQPVEILNQNNVQLYASELLREGDIQTVKVPINSEEYFLLENRQINLDRDPVTGLLADSITGVVLGPVNRFTKQFNREYDNILPGSGILIWHIDEGVAYLDYNNNGIDNFTDNALQCDKDRRFITLEEADGVIDFGGNYYTGYGLQEDMYYLGNNSNFTPYTFPSSRSNNRSETHIYITNIGSDSIVMGFNVKNDISLSSWPQRVILGSGNSSLVYGDLDGDGKDEIITASGKLIYAWRMDGSKYIPNADSIRILGLDDRYYYYPLAVFAEADTTIFGTPSLGDLNGDDSLEVVVGDLDGKLYIWKASDKNSDGKADLIGGFPDSIGEQISMTPVIADLKATSPGPEVFVGTKDGAGIMIEFTDYGIGMARDNYNESVIGFSTTNIDSVNFILTENNQSGHLRRITRGKISDESRDWIKEIPSTGNFPPVVGNVNRDSKLDVIVLSGDGKIYAWDIDGNLLSGFPVIVGDIRSGPALGDIDADGYLEIVFGGDNKVYAYNYNGALATNFPFIIDRVEPAGAISSTPILGDLNGDGNVEIIFGLKDGRVFALQSDGLRFNLFPLALSGEIVSSGIVVDDSISENRDYVRRNFFFKSEDGLVYGYSLDFQTQDWEEKTPWLMYGYNSGHTNSFPDTLLPDIPRYAELMPEKSVYNYPNPAKNQTTIRYFLSKEATVNIKIYDLSGDLVAEANQPGDPYTNNKYVWDCSKYASGVYLCRVEAKSSEGKKVAFCKIALVK